ncbi:hypothetical protein [Nisaea sediminum]|uniref:hypothetical protein n=1 Tax=Nisaea sediminum TaxID=2775867 RepID=UPI00186710EF|nr:hypothetical protein [Nisaea sediminum]
MGTINWNDSIYLAYQFGYEWSNKGNPYPPGGGPKGSFIYKGSVAYDDSNGIFCSESFNQTSQGFLEFNFDYSAPVQTFLFSFCAFNSDVLFLCETVIDPGTCEFVSLSFFTEQPTSDGSLNFALPTPAIDQTEFKAPTGAIRDVKLASAGRIAFLIIATDTALSISTFDGIRLSAPTLIPLSFFSSISSIDAESMLLPASGHGGGQVMVAVMGASAGTRQVAVKLYGLDLLNDAPELSEYQANITVPNHTQYAEPALRLGSGCLAPDASMPQSTTPGYTLMLILEEEEPPKSNLAYGYGRVFVGCGTLDGTGDPSDITSFELIEQTWPTVVPANLGACSVTVRKPNSSPEVAYSFLQLFCCIYRNQPEDKTAPFVTSITFQKYQLKQIGSPETAPTTASSGDPDEWDAAVSAWILQGIILGPPPYPTNFDYGSSTSVFGLQTQDSGGQTLSYKTTAGVSVSAGPGIGQVFSVDATYSNSVSTGSEVNYNVSKLSSESLSAEINQLASDGNTVGWYIFLEPTYTRYDYQLYTFDGNKQISYNGQDPITLISIFLDSPLDDPISSTCAFYITDPSTAPTNPSIAAGPPALYVFSDPTEIATWPQSSNCGSSPELNWYSAFAGARTTECNLVPADLGNQSSSNIIGGLTGLIDNPPSSASTLFSYSKTGTKSTTNTVSVGGKVSIGVFHSSEKSTFEIEHSITQTQDLGWQWSAQLGNFTQIHEGSEVPDGQTAFAQVNENVLLFGFGNQTPTLQILPAVLSKQKPWVVGYEVTQTTATDS